MKSLFITLFALAVALPGASMAQERGDCSVTSTRGRCKAPPPPPAPPPLPAMADMPGPTPPLPPMPPAPPPPPPAPEVPESAHAACAGKQAGTRLTLTPRKGLTMTGSCQRDSQGMYFDLEQMRDDQ